jgi:selenide,water dikinase
MQFPLASMPGARPRRWMLVTDQPALLPGHAGGVGRRLDAILEERGVALHFDSSVVAYEAGAIVTRGGRRIAADRVFVATGAAAWPWLAQSGLACDARGFVRVNEHLQSPAHPFVFAAGDCASQDGHPHPKSGLHAVRHGPVLAENLRRFAIGEPLASFAPPRRALALIGTGDERAIVSYGPFAAAGAWAWRWKDRIDRAHVAKYRIAAGAGIEGAAQD